MQCASVELDSVLGPLRLARHTCWCPGISVVPEAMLEGSRGPYKGAVSPQKALQGPETRELLGETEEKSISQRGVIDLPPRQINFYLYAPLPNI